MNYSKYKQVFCKPNGRVRRGPPNMSVIKPEGEWLIPTLYIQRLIAQDCLEPTKAKIAGEDGSVKEVKLPEPEPEVKADASTSDKGETKPSSSLAPPASDLKTPAAKPATTKPVKTET